MQQGTVVVEDTFGQSQILNPAQHAETIGAVDHLANGMRDYLIKVIQALESAERVFPDRVSLETTHGKVAVLESAIDHLNKLQNIHGKKK